MLTVKQRNLSLACGVIFVDMIGYGIVIPTVPIYSKKLGATEAEIGLLFASYSLALLLTLIPFGLVVDRYGRKILIVLGMFFLTLSSILYAFSYSLSQLTLSRIIQGISASCTWAAALPLAADATARTKKGLEMSSVAIATGLGAIMGPIIGGMGTIHTPFFICGILAFALCLLSIRYLEEMSYPKTYDNLKDKLARISVKRGIQAACIASVSLYFALGMLEALFPLYMHLHHYHRIWVGLLFSIFGIFYVLIQPIVGAWSDRIGRMFPIISGLLLSALVLPVPFHSHSLLPWIISFSILGISMAAPYAPSLPLISESTDAEDYGVAYGLYSTSFCVGYTLGPWSGGNLAETAGIKLSFYLSSILLTLSALAIYLMNTGSMVENQCSNP